MAPDAAPAPWPPTLSGRMRAVLAALAGAAAPVTPADVARAFAGARAPDVADLLDTLAALAHAREVEPGRYAA